MIRMVQMVLRRPGASGEIVFHEITLKIIYFLICIFITCMSDSRAICGLKAFIALKRKREREGVWVQWV